LIPEQGIEDTADIREVGPIAIGAAQAAHLQPQDQTHVLQSHFGQQTLETAALVGAGGGLPLILINDQDALLGPTQFLGIIGQGVLPCPRLAVVEHLLWAGLPDVDNRQPFELCWANFARTAVARESMLLGRGSLRRLWLASTMTKRFMLAHASPPWRRAVARDVVREGGRAFAGCVVELAPAASATVASVLPAVGRESGEKGGIVDLAHDGPP
jgi:hypothetical protein